VRASVRMMGDQKAARKAVWRRPRKILVGVVAFAVLGGGIAVFRPKDSKEARACRQVSKYREELGLPKTNLSDDDISSAFRQNQAYFGGWVSDLNCTGQHRVTGRIMKFLVLAKPQEAGALSVVVKYFVRSQARFPSKKQSASFDELFSDPGVAEVFSAPAVEGWTNKVSTGEATLASALNAVVAEKVDSQNRAIFQRLVLEVPSKAGVDSANTPCTYEAEKWQAIGYPVLNASSDEFARVLGDEVLQKSLGNWIHDLGCSHPEVIGRVVKVFLESKPQQLSQLALVAVDVAAAVKGEDEAKEAETFGRVFSLPELQSLIDPKLVGRAAGRVRSGESGIREAFVEAVEQAVDVERRSEFLLLVGSL
jgi:hypothetical protein